MTLVGREKALGVVEEVLAAGSGCVVVEGPSGIGKSRLLDEAVRRGRARGFAVAYGRATELDRVAPLSTLSRALGTVGTLNAAGGGGSGDGGFTASGDGLAAGGGAFSAGGGGFNAGGGGFAAIERLGEVIDRFTRSRPLMIVLDDVQWADELTCLALRQLVPGPAGSPVVWLLARRPLPEQEAVERMIAEGARRLPLPPLSPDEAAELCERVLGARPGASVLELARAGVATRSSWWRC
ncbi:AAA family ATPase [Nonomuraea antimicrobica]